MVVGCGLPTALASLSGPWALEHVGFSSCAWAELAHSL